MNPRLILPALALALLGAASCKDDAEPAEPSAQHAPDDVEPGTHADWCGEHGVPESQCTRCHPGLVAAFKATDDWCEEHGLPDSHCKKCNPDLVIERPPKEAKP